MPDPRYGPFTIAEARALPQRVLTDTLGAPFLVRDLLVLICDYYEAHPTGGALHCSLDDGNMEDRHVRWDTERARQASDYAAWLIGTLLQLLPERERFLLAERGYDPRDVLHPWLFEGWEGPDA